MNKRKLVIASAVTLSFIFSSAAPAVAGEDSDTSPRPGPSASASRSPSPAEGNASTGRSRSLADSNASPSDRASSGHSLAADDSLDPTMTLDGETISSQSGDVVLETVDGQAAITSGDDDSRMLLEGEDPELTAEDGLGIVSPRDVPSTSFSIAPTSRRSVRVHSVLESEQAPERFSYSFPQADFIEVDDEDGIAYLFAYNEAKTEASIVGVVDAPWAHDARGVEVPTHFEADGSTLTQVVEHRQADVAYPVTADPDWWDNIKSWFSNASKYAKDKAKSAANWLKSKAGWLKDKTWSGVKWVSRKGGKAAKFFAKKVGPGAAVLCLAGGTWRWYRSDASGWVRVGDAVTGCIG
ncbi:MAG: hypothetical protein Q3979_04820 [Actinomycetaceae bacterium]|nr:hypothetical protein [Actinomycetaceae bacterium]